MLQVYAEAVSWYRIAADQGDADAQYNLGTMYRDGEGVPRDYAEALKWFRRAADQEHARAQYTLGVMYDVGRGVTQDYVLAHMWFNLCAAKYKPIWNCAKIRAEVAEKMTPSQIAEAHKLARE